MLEQSKAESGNLFFGRNRNKGASSTIWLTVNGLLKIAFTGAAVQRVCVLFICLVSVCELKKQLIITCLGDVYIESGDIRVSSRRRKTSTYKDENFRMLQVRENLVSAENLDEGGEKRRIRIGPRERRNTGVL